MVDSKTPCLGDLRLIPIFSGMFPAQIYDCLDAVSLMVSGYIRSTWLGGPVKRSGNNGVKITGELEAAKVKTGSKKTGEDAPTDNP
jgi:hypothetical protein